MVLREKVTREIDAMNTNQLCHEVRHMHGKQPVKGTTKSDYRKIFENVDPSVWLAATEYIEASRIIDRNQVRIINCNKKAFSLFVIR